MAHEIFVVRIDDISIDEFESRVRQWLDGEGGKVIFTPNAEFLLLASRNDAFRILLNQSDLSIPDSVSLRFAVAALTDGSLKNRIPGVDALNKIVELCATKNQRVVLLGGEDGVQTKAAGAFKTQFPALAVVGVDPGVVAFDGTKVEIAESVVSKLRELAPDVVAVALGQGRQEFAIEKLKALIPGVKIWIGVGGALDMIAGGKPRAPRWICHFGFEWFWRLCIEPCRWRRTVNAAVIFPLIVIRDTLKSRCFVRAAVRVAKEIFLQIKGL